MPGWYDGSESAAAELEFTCGPGKPRMASGSRCLSLLFTSLASPVSYILQRPVSMCTPSSSPAAHHHTHVLKPFHPPSHPVTVTVCASCVVRFVVEHMSDGTACSVCPCLCVAESLSASRLSSRLSSMHARTGPRRSEAPPGGVSWIRGRTDVQRASGRGNKRRERRGCGTQNSTRRGVTVQSASVACLSS